MQILANLLNNAAKYTPEGGRIAFTIEREGDDAVFRVRDSGVGIAAEMLPRVFDLFTQIDRSLDRAEGGLGIGLTLVHRLVEMHGGTVQVFSEGLGCGSEFVVRLPVVVAPCVSEQPLNGRLWHGLETVPQPGKPAASALSSWTITATPRIAWPFCWKAKGI